MAATSWEDLRRRAKVLENEIETKLVGYSKYCASLATASLLDNRTNSPSKGSSPLASNSAPNLASLGGSSGGGGGGGGGVGEPLLAEARLSEKVEANSGAGLGRELEVLISQLAEVNEGLSRCASLGVDGVPGGAAAHTLQRHREVLRGYQAEYRKTAANVAAVRDRQDLLSSVRQEISDYKASGVDHLLRERRALDGTETKADALLAQMAAAQEDLEQQGTVFTNINNRVNSMAERFPIINSMLNTIKRRKTKNMVILAVFTSLCIIVLILYSRH